MNAPEGPKGPGAQALPAELRPGLGAQAGRGRRPCTTPTVSYACALVRARVALRAGTGAPAALRRASPEVQGDALPFDAADYAQAVADHAAGPVGDDPLLYGACAGAHGAPAVYLAGRRRGAGPVTPATREGQALPRGQSVRRWGHDHEARSVTPPRPRRRRAEDDALVAPARSPSERRSTCHGKIEALPDVLGGKPVIAGTRISVELVLEKLGAGWAGADLLDAYPALVEADILAALRYAADVFRTEVIFPLPPTPPGPAAPPPGPGAEAAG